MRRAQVFVILFATFLLGCSSKQTPLTPRSPHGGMLLSLPDDSGSIEVTRQAIAERPGWTRLSLYFLDPELKPMAEIPTIATLKSRGRAGQTITFKPSPEGDSAGALVSPDLPDKGDIDGVLEVAVDGKPISLSIGVR